MLDWLRIKRLVALIGKHEDDRCHARKWGFGYSNAEWRDHKKSQTRRRHKAERIATKLGPEKTRQAIDAYEVYDSYGGKMKKVLEPIATPNPDGGTEG